MTLVTFIQLSTTGNGSKRTTSLKNTYPAGAATTCVTLMTFFQAKRFRPFRASLFVALGGWGAVPAVHAALLHWGNSHVTHALQHSVVMGVVYVVRFFRPAGPWLSIAAP